MEVSKIIKSNIIYYYLAAIIFTMLIIATLYIFTEDMAGGSSINFMIILPIISVILGFLAGGAKSYAKWGFPIYIALLTFCLTVFVYGFEDWILILTGFCSSLIGVVIRHFVRNKTGEKK